MKMEKVLTRLGFSLAFEDGESETWNLHGYYVSVYEDDRWYMDFPPEQERPAIVGYGGGQLALAITTFLPEKPVIVS